MQRVINCLLASPACPTFGPIEGGKKATYRNANHKRNRAEPRVGVGFADGVGAATRHVYLHFHRLSALLYKLLYSCVSALLCLLVLLRFVITSSGVAFRRECKKLQQTTLSLPVSLSGSAWLLRDVAITLASCFS